MTLRILLVGDEGLTPEALRTYLKEGLLKAEVIFCPCGSQAAAEAAAASSTVAIAHMNLPGTEHGLEILRQVKEANSGAYTMLLLRRGLFTELEERINGGVDALIGLPIQGKGFRELLRRVSRILEDREAGAYRRKVFHQINTSLVQSREREKPWLAVPAVPDQE
jgi:DNA-binding response OmpR family regulator